MPAMQPPPGTRLGGIVDVEQVARERRQRQERARPGRAAARARSRGSSWPRLAKRGADFAEAASVRASRARNSLDQREHGGRGCRRQASPSAASAESRDTGTSVPEHARLAARWKPSNCRRRLAARHHPVAARVAARAPSMRRQAPEMNAAASDSRNTMAAETSASVPSRAAGTCCAAGSGSAASSPRGRCPCRSRRSSPAPRR